MELLIEACNLFTMAINNCCTFVCIGMTLVWVGLTVISAVGALGAAAS